MEYKSHSTQLIFLHGLLGDKNDWQNVMEKLPHFSCEAIDLPFHGEAADISADNFDQVCDYLAQQIQRLQTGSPYYLVGYSLGGRIALHYALDWLAKHPQNTIPQGLILEGANLGLQTTPQKQQRWQQDLHWAQRFATEPMQTVLQDWYQQPVFASLTPTQRQTLIVQRCHHQGAHIAQMLKATSLAKQRDFRDEVRSSFLPIYYFCGEQDHKFRQMAQQANLDLTLIPQAGHNAHRDNPHAFTTQLIQKITLKQS